MSNESIAKVRELLAAATPGPWEVRTSGSGVSVQAVQSARGMRAAGDPYPMIARMPKDYAPDHSNAALIAAAPELLALLCDELEEAEARATKSAPAEKRKNA